MDLKAVNPWSVAVVALGWDQGWVDLEYDIVEGGTEVCAIDSRVTRGFRIVDIFTFGAIELHCLHIWVVGLAHRKERMCLAHDSRAFSKIRLLVFLELHLMLA